MKGKSKTMSKKQPDDTIDTIDNTNQNDTALAVIQKGTSVQKLPPALQQKLARYQMREAAGFAPQWKPTKVGDYLLGKILAIRGTETQYGNATVITLLCDDGVQRAIFLGRELLVKLNDAVTGQVYVIQYDGIESKKDNPRLKNDMKKFSVIEVMP